MRENSFRSAILLCLSTSCAFAAAGDRAEDIRNLDTNIGLAFQFTHLTYEEPSNTEAFFLPDEHPYLDKESGWLSGFRLAASYLAEEDRGGIYASILYSRVSSDHITYVGHYQDGTPVTLTGQSAIGDGWLRVGRGFTTGTNTVVTPFVGLGYHWWDRGLEGQGYEYYSHKDWDIGALVQHSPAKHWVITGMLAAGRTFGAKFKYPDVGFGSTDLGSSDVVKAGLEVDYGHESFHVFLGWDYYSFRYGQSDIVATPYGDIMEPMSTTELMNVALGVRFSR